MYIDMCIYIYMSAVYGRMGKQRSPLLAMYWPTAHAHMYECAYMLYMYACMCICTYTTTTANVFCMYTYAYRAHIPRNEIQESRFS